MRKEVHDSLIIEDKRIDIRFMLERGTIKHFAINVAILTDDKTEDVFRVDTAHKGLHVMKFWISPKPKYLEEERKDNYNSEFSRWKKEVIESCVRWVELYKKAKGERR